MQLWNTPQTSKILAAALILACGPSGMVFAQFKRPSMVKHTGASTATSKAGANSPRAALHQPEFLEQYAATHRFSAGRPVGVYITRDGDAVLFLRSGPRSFQARFVRVQCRHGQRTRPRDGGTVARRRTEKLSAEEKARRERMRLSAGGIASFEVSADGRTILVPLSGKLFLIDRATGKSHELAGTSGSIDPRLSPDGKFVAWVRDGDLFVLEIASGKEQRLTQGATETLTRGLAEFVAQEEMGRMHGYWWSPDSRHLVYEETDTSQVEQFSIPDPAHPERPAQMFRYPRPGEEQRARASGRHPGRRRPNPVARLGPRQTFPTWLASFGKRMRRW